MIGDALRRVPPSAGVVEWGGLLGAGAVLAWGVLAPSPEAASPPMRSALAVFGATLVLWITEAVPYAVSSVASVVLLAALGVVDGIEAAATGFSSSLLLFLVLLFLLGGAISGVDLDAWIAARLLSTSGRSGRPLRSIASHLLMLACLMPSAAARAVTFVPIVRRIAGTRDGGVEGPFGTASFLVVSHVNPLASMAFMTGGGMAVVTSSLVEESVGPMSWVRWAVLMVPPVLALYAASYLTIETLYDRVRADEGRRENRGEGDRVEGRETAEVDDATGKQRTPAPDGATEGRTDRYPETGDEQSFTRDQLIVGSVLAGTVCLWIVGSFVGLSTVVPAALAVFVLAAPGVGIVDSEDVRGISWGVLFMLGAMLSILDALESTGALGYVTRAATGVVPFASLAHWQVIGLLLVLTAVVRLFFSTGSAALVVTLPVFLGIAGRFGINRLYLALGVLLVVGSTSILPFNATATLVAFDRGPLSNRVVAAFGLVTMGYSLLVVALAWLLYWPLVS